MPDDLEKAMDGRLTRFRARLAERRDVRADRRARRRGHVGDPDSAVRQAESGNFKSGGYFTKKTGSKP